MTDDLKRQASELYKERTEEIRTSDSLSMKKLFYIVLGLSLLAALIIQTFGGLKHHGNPASTGGAPPPVAKELPPPAPSQSMAPPSQPEPAKLVDQKPAIEET